jgi:septation ring formation regulator EzrA
LSPNEAEKLVAVRELFPKVLETLLAQEQQLGEILELLSNLKNVFSELQNYDELQTWSEKGLELLNAIKKARR